MFGKGCYQYITIKDVVFLYRGFAVYITVAVSGMLPFWLPFCAKNNALSECFLCTLPNPYEKD